MFRCPTLGVAQNYHSRVHGGRISKVQFCLGGSLICRDFKFSCRKNRSLHASLWLCCEPCMVAMSLRTQMRTHLVSNKKRMRRSGYSIESTKTNICASHLGLSPKDTRIRSDTYALGRLKTFARGAFNPQRKRNIVCADGEGGMVMLMVASACLSLFSPLYALSRV